MTKIRDILQDALIEVGTLAADDQLSSGDASFALRVLNRMVSSWANEDLMIVSQNRLTFSLVANQQSYTIGVGGNFNTPYPVRPGQIDLASVMFGNVEIPVEMLNDEQWRDISLKTTYSTFPLQMWANGNYPLDVLYFWPIPTTPAPLILSVWGQITAFATVNDDVALPPGYEDALVYNLAVRLANSYKVPLGPQTGILAVESKRKIKEMNFEPTYRSVDSALSGSHNNIGQRSRGYVVD